MRHFDPRRAARSDPCFPAGCSPHEMRRIWGCRGHQGALPLAALPDYRSSSRSSNPQDYPNKRHVRHNLEHLIRSCVSCRRHPRPHRSSFPPIAANSTCHFTPYVHQCEALYRFSLSTSLIPRTRHIRDGSSHNERQSIGLLSCPALVAASIPVHLLPPPPPWLRPSLPALARSLLADRCHRPSRPRP